MEIVHRIKSLEKIMYKNISYEDLIFYLKNKCKESSKIKFIIKSNYSIIKFSKSNYHITVYQDQWDEYQIKTSLYKNLFHVTSDDIIYKKSNKCSVYFWLDISTREIKEVSPEYFSYEEDTYTFRSSTRKKCIINDDIMKIIKQFHRIIIRI